MQYTQTVEAVLASLKSSSDGLSSAEAMQRLKVSGSNRLPQSGQHASRIKIFFEQWKSPLILLLLVAGTVSGLLGERLDMGIIYGTAIINALIGFFQEDKANRALSKLQSLVTYKAVVMRDGKKQQIDSVSIVPGDIVFLTAGDQVQADGRVFRATDFSVNESALTGESEPVDKQCKKLSKDLTPADQTNMVFRGTVVVGGEGIMIVTACGVQTEIGTIATLVQETKDEKTPLQMQLSRLAMHISVVVVAMAVLIFAVGIFVGGDRYTVLELFETAVAVAVAAIPEGLTISLTVILAIGMQYIVRRKALVRKLLAAETLGSVSVICTDKTGTLTEGNMRVTELVTAGDALTFEELSLVDWRDGQHDDAVHALRIGTLCNNATLEGKKGEQKKWKMFGDTTETAFLYASATAGMFKQSIDGEVQRLAEVPFSSDTKYMATLNSAQGQLMINVKGAPEVIIEKATHYEENGKQKKLTEAKRIWFLSEEDRLAKRGLRVLALACVKPKDGQKSLEKKDIKNVTLVGIVGLSDPLRPDAKETLATAKRAGIHVAMITGDHVKTAQAIAAELGLPNDDGHVLNGSALTSMSEDELRAAVRNVTIFARVDPKHKIRIVRAFQANGEVVAMTGDGVNDAPALKGSDIGVALGSGTDVAKETSDIVLLNDGVETIVAAIEEGRAIYQNIKKVVLYLLSGSFAEVVMITGSIVAGFPVAALPAQILWVNIIEDTFPNMALAFDKGDKENMHDPPRKKDEHIVDKEMRIMIVLKSILANVALFAIFVFFWKTTGDIKLTRTIVFVGFGIDALFFIFSIRSLRYMIWQRNPCNNLYLVAAVLFGWFMLLIAIYWPPLQYVLRTVPLEPQHWVLMIAFGLFNMVLIETIKGIFIIKRKRYGIA